MPANFCFNHKEQVVIKEMVKGLNNKQIAKKTQMGESTVKWYVAKINQKTGAVNKINAIFILAKSGYFDRFDKRLRNF